MENEFYLPSADEIRFETKKNGDYTEITYYKNEKELLNFSTILNSEVLQKMINGIQLILSDKDNNIKPIEMKNGEEPIKIYLCGLWMDPSGPPYVQFVEPWVLLDLYYSKEKMETESKTEAWGPKKKFLRALYNMILQVEPSMKNEVIESLLKTNLFAYYEISSFELRVVDVKESKSGFAYLTVEDGCGNQIICVDEEFQKHKEDYKVGSCEKYKVKFKVTSIEKNKLIKKLNDDSKFNLKSKFFWKFPKYEFAAVASNIKRDEKEIYSFTMNMMNNSEEKNVRPILARVRCPVEINIDEGEVISGKGYFVVSKYYGKDFYEYGKIYPIKRMMNFHTK